MAITFTSKIGHLSKLKMHYVIVTDAILEQFLEESDKSLYNQRFHVTVNNVVKWQGGTVSLGNNAGYINLSGKRMKELDVSLDDVVNVTLEKDHSEYGFNAPEEFEEVLRQDDEGNRRFMSLTKGKRRAIIYLIVQIKSSEKRIDKSIFFIENLKRAPLGEETMRHALGKDLP